MKDFLFGIDQPSATSDEAAVLTTTHGNMELCLVRSILEGEGIPYRVRDRGAGGVVRIVAGDSPFGCDVLVPADMLKKAQELLDAYRNGEVVEDGEAADEEEAD